jgi:hypothetical protein
MQAVPGAATPTSAQQVLITDDEAQQAFCIARLPAQHPRDPEKTRPTTGQYSVATRAVVTLRVRTAAGDRCRAGKGWPSTRPSAKALATLVR